MNLTRTLAASTFACLTLAGLMLIPSAAAQDRKPPTPPVAPAPTTPGQSSAVDQNVTENDIINGTMDIDFGTRTNLDTSGDLKAGSPALGAKDKYKFSFNVAKTTQFAGEINRQPNLFSKYLASRK